MTGERVMRPRTVLWPALELLGHTFFEVKANESKYSCDGVTVQVLAGGYVAECDGFRSASMSSPEEALRSLGARLAGASNLLARITEAQKEVDQ